MKIHSPQLTSIEFIIGFIYYILQLIVIPALLIVVNMFLLPIPCSEAVMNFIFFAVNFFAVVLIFRKFLWKNLKVALNQPRKVLRFSFYGLIIYFFGTSVITTVNLWLSPNFANINDQSIMLMMEDHFALMVIGTVLLVPIAEELFYRGLMFRQLFDRRPILAYLLSMSIFSAIHVAGYVGMTDWLTLLLCFFQYLPASFALAWSYHRSGSIFTSVLTHTVVNLIGMLAMR